MVWPGQQIPQGLPCVRQPVSRWVRFRQPAVRAAHWGAADRRPSVPPRRVRWVQPVGEPQPVRTRGLQEVARLLLERELRRVVLPEPLIVRERLGAAGSVQEVPSPPERRSVQDSVAQSAA